MKRSKFLAWLISLGMISSPALAIDIKGKQRKSEDATALIVFLTYGKLLHEVVGYSNEYKTGIDKLTVGYAVKKVCEYNSKEARKERLRRKLEDIIEKSDLERKLGKEGQVGKLLRAEMRDQNFVDYFNCINDKNEAKKKFENMVRSYKNKLKGLKGLSGDEKKKLLMEKLQEQKVDVLYDRCTKKIDDTLVTPKILSAEVVDEMLAVTTMSDKEKSFVKTNVNFYLCAVRSFDSWSFKILGLLKSYDFLESYKENPLIIKNSASTPHEHELLCEFIRNEVAGVRFSYRQLMNGDYLTEKYKIKPLKILKKVNGKLVLEDENEYTIEKNEMVKEFFENV